MTHRKHSFLRQGVIILVISMLFVLPTASAMEIEDLVAEIILEYLFGDAWYVDGGLDAYRDNEFGWLEYPSDSEYAIYIDEQTGYLFGLYTNNTAYIAGHLDFTYSSPQQKTDLHIPATVMGVPVDGVGEGAFTNIDNIGHVYVAEGVRSIGVSAFAGSSITGITLPSTLRFIEYDAFEGCQSLGNVALPEGLQFIGSSAFLQCPGITRVIIPDSVTDIQFDAFSECANLESVHIGSGLNELEGNVFSLSPKLKTLTLSERNPTFYMLDGILYNRYKNSIVRYPGMNRQDVAFTVPNGITCVEDSCFADANTLKRIILPDSVTKIEDYAFYGCERCEFLDLGENVASIGEGAILTNQMRGIWLPASVTSLEELSLFSFTNQPYAYDSFWVLATEGSYAAAWAREQGYEVYSPSEDMLIAIGAMSQKAETLNETSEEAMEEEVVISGSFGDDSYTMKAGEKLDVPVSASAANASLTRVTINVDGDSNNRLASTEVSGSSWNGSIMLDGNVAPLNAPGSYTLKLFAAVGPELDEWAEVDRATLVVSEVMDVKLDAQIQVLKKVSIQGLQGPFATAKTQLTATARVKGGSGQFTYAWSVVKPDGTTYIPESTTTEVFASFDYWHKGSLELCLTVADNVTGEEITITQDVKVQCPHMENGTSALDRQSDPVMVGDETGHALAHVDICLICNEKITTASSEEKNPHFFTSDADGKLTCSYCQYVVMPESFAEAANIVGSPAYRIYNNKVFPLNSADGLFKSTASSVIEHRVNDRFLVFLEELYDVMDNEDFDDIETAVKKQVVYETLQDILCERADETMSTAIGITQIIDNNESVIKEVGSVLADEGINKVWDVLELTRIEKAYMNIVTGPRLKAIDCLIEGGKIINASQQEYAKIAFCLSMNEETDRALRIMREEMGSSYTEIIDDLLRQNEEGLLAAVLSQTSDAAGLILELCGKAVIDYSAFTVVPGIIDAIAETSHQAYLTAFRDGKTVAEVTSQMRTTAMWNQVSQGANIVGSIIAGLKIGHAIGGAADALLYAQDQLTIILPYEITAYSNMYDAYRNQDSNLYEITCVYLETLKQGYSAAKALYDAHDTAFARFCESAEETEACISLSNRCQTKMDQIDDYLQLLSEESNKYVK